jgi:hypothetical protein
VKFSAGIADSGSKGGTICATFAKLSWFSYRQGRQVDQSKGCPEGLTEPSDSALDATGVTGATGVSGDVSVIGVIAMYEILTF